MQRSDQPSASTARPLITARDIEDGSIQALPPGAVLTPLARDLARRRGLPVDLAAGGPPRTRRLLVANWKSHKTLGEALAFADAWRAASASLRPGAARAVVCPPHTALAALGQALAGSADLGAQDLSPHDEGAHTGEVAARHLVDVGCRFALVGHSERRHAGEGDALCRAKLRAALRGGLDPILCVGETGEERRAGRTALVVGDQLRASLEGLTPDELRRVVVAYEPRWAIGSGLTPTLAEVSEVLLRTRAVLERLSPAGADVALLYGGSVSEANAAELLSLPECAGALVGGASLEAARFAAIVAASGAASAPMTAAANAAATLPRPSSAGGR